MLKVVRGLLKEMPVEVVNQMTCGGAPARWTALSIACNNARDPHNERPVIVQLLVEAGAELEVRNAFGATPLLTVCQVGYVSVVRVLLDARADASATNNRGRNALDVTPPGHNHVS